MPDDGPGGFLTLGDLEGAARARLSDAVWAYVDGGAAEETTLRDNRAAFHRRTLRPRVLAGVDRVDLRRRLLDRPASAPVFLAPTAYQGLLDPEAELATARAAREGDVPAIFSTLSTRSLEEIAEASGPGDRWFQLYLQPDFERSVELVSRAERAGYRALVLTVDMPLLANRDRQIRGGVAVEAPVPVGNGADIVSPSRAPTVEDGVYRWRAETGATWEVVDRLRSHTRLPIVVKGILTGEDASRAAEHGARAVIVSNHGGRQLDGAPAALDALSEVVAAVGAKLEVYLDGGVRRGSDIAMALALAGRPSVDAIDPTLLGAPRG